MLPALLFSLLLNCSPEKEINWEEEIFFSTVCYDDPSYLYSRVVSEQEVMVLEYDNGGIPYASTAKTHIEVNEDFFEHPRYFREWLIAHELGHLHLGHLDNMDDIDRGWYVYMWKTADPTEVEADLFAVDEIGEAKVLKALVYAHNLCAMIPAPLCKTEALYRIISVNERICTMD